MNWKYNPGDLVTWQGTRARQKTTGYVIVIAHIPATEALSSYHAKEATKILRSGKSFWELFFEEELKKIPASSKRDRYLVWVPSKSGEIGIFQSPIKQTFESATGDSQ